MFHYKYVICLCLGLISWSIYHPILGATTKPTATYTDKHTVVLSKIEKIRNLYERKRYTKAGNEIEELLPLLTKQTELAEMQWLQAYCNYHNHLFEISSNQFHLFIEHHPASPKIEEAIFMRGYSLARIEVDILLDQKTTYDAMAYLEQYSTIYPTGSYISQAEDARQQLEQHLMQKSLQAAHCYIRLGYYKAAIVTLQNFQQTYPHSPLQTEVDRLFLISYKELPETITSEAHQARIMAQIRNEEYRKQEGMQASNKRKKV